MNQLSRRNFLKFSGTLLGSGILPAYGNSNLTMSADPMTAAIGNNLQTNPIQINRQSKALVFIMLAGGNDSFNMLVPTTPAEYRQYQATRSNLALNQTDLLPLNGFRDANGSRFGLHPAMPEVKQLFQQKKLSFIANCGPLITPVNKTAFLNNTAELPVGLMSHSDQARHWQTANPGERERHGWFGRYADVLQSGKPDSQIAMNISLSGNNILQNGQESSPYTIEQEGSTGLVIKENPPGQAAGQQALNNILLNGVNHMLNRQYSDPFMQSYINTLRHAQTYHEQFQGAVSSINPATEFSPSSLSQQLKMVARSIAASASLGLPQQTFFIEYGGWDHHDELLQNQNRMLGVLSNALAEFDTALHELNVADKTVTFTGSDFGRTLTSNGNGTDHGWGGNIMIMGNAVKGGEVFGEFPALALNSGLDVGNGVLIPTTATDEIFAELSLWFGVAKQDLPRLFPNLENFYAVTDPANPLGIIQA
ncbi:MAG: DUF1501 domain-containing protein [Thiolinea sp.]